MAGYGVSKTPMYLFEGLARGHRTAIGSLSLGYGSEIILSKDQVERFGVRKMVREKKIAYRGQVDDTDSRLDSIHYEYLEGLAGGFNDNCIVLNTMMADTAVDTANRLAWVDGCVDRMIGVQKAMVNATAWPSANNAATLDLDNRVLFMVTKTVDREVVKITSGYWYDDSAGTYTDLALGSGIATLNNAGDTDDYIYLGADAKFSHVYVSLGNTNSNSVTLDTVEYWNGTAWVEFDTVTDMTDAVAKTFAISGFIAWYETPDDWTLATVSATSNKYWVRLATTGAMDATVSAYFNVLNEEPLIPMDVRGTNLDLLSKGEYSDNGVFYNITYTTTFSFGGFVAAQDAMYWGFTQPVAGLIIDIGTTPNVNASVMSGDYWNGGAWATLSITDGTIQPAGTTLGQNGAITWAVPAMWIKGTAADIFGGEGTEELYWVRLTVNGDLTVNTDIDAILPLVAPYAIQEYEAPKGGMLKPSEKLKIYVGEIEALNDALSNIEVKVIGFSL